jgi:prepilin-type N-terminal cleavage/methylation domain-containing protein
VALKLERFRDERGMTLVELMIVVTIIAIIAAIVMTLYQEIQKKTRLAADEATVTSLRSAVAIYYGKTNGLFPADLTTASALVTPAPTWQCSALPTYFPSNGKIVFTTTLSDC